MDLFRNRGLQTKINLIILVILLAFFGLFSFVSFRQQKNYIVEEAVEKARIIASTAIRSRQYVSSQLQAGGVELTRERYGLIPQVVSTRLGGLVAEDLGYSIRQISERYRNPKNAPDPSESVMLQQFYQDPSLEETYRVTYLDEEPIFRYLHPFIVEQSCLPCHDVPAEAPAFIHEMFPDKTEQSFHYRIGEVIGAVSVSIPMGKLQAQIQKKVRTDLLYSGGVLLALVCCLGLLIRVAVTAPLARLGLVIRDIVRTGRFEKPIPRRGRDEIGTLIDGFNDMMVRLGEKTAHLEESEKRFRVLTETARDGIISFLGNGQIILFNRQAERIFGYSKREVLGVSVARLVHEECAEFHSAGVEGYLKSNAAQLVRKLHKFPGRRRDGAIQRLELSLAVAESEGHLFYTAIVRECS
ncbi:c-type heme family protein [Trichloromonas sp.]|uniref:Tll0287-like domain-containing protein n=1 Tax=Trichloromonas sp. TaxID=3069249 RepID=UPI003D816315